MSEQVAVNSPCIGVCAIDDASGLCQGCYRSLTEIQQWWDLSPTEQQTVVDAASARMAALF